MLRGTYINMKRLTKILHLLTTHFFLLELTIGFFRYSGNEAGGMFGPFVYSRAFRRTARGPMVAWPHRPSLGQDYAF